MLSPRKVLNSQWLSENTYAHPIWPRPPPPYPFLPGRPSALRSVVVAMAVAMTTVAIATEAEVVVAMAVAMTTVAIATEAEVVVAMA